MDKHTKQVGGKDHSKSIEIGEGLEFGEVHPAHTKIKPKDAVHNTKVQKKAHAFNERSQNGGAEKMGGDCQE